MSNSTENSKITTRKRKATSPEARENQLIALTIDKVEERIRNGKASSQEYVHFLRLGTEKARLEKEKLQKENELLRAKTENLEMQKRSEELTERVIRVMKEYNGIEVDEEYDDDY